MQVVGRHPPGKEKHAMTTSKHRAQRGTWKELLTEDKDLLRSLVHEALEQVLEAEMTDALAADKGERVSTRLGYRSGYYTRGIVTRVGTMELRVPRDREGRFSTQLFERYQRSEKALVSSLMEMYVQGVSTRKVKAITEELCGHAFSASAVSAINKGLDEGLEEFARRRLDSPYPYLILDARYERVREGGVVHRRAVLVAIGISWEGRREVLGVEMASRESATSWKGFLVGLRDRGLIGVEMVVTDDHEGLTRAIFEVIPEAAWQRCYVHFLRNARDYLPRKADDDCLQELRWLYERQDLAEAQRDMAAWLSRWEGKYPKLCDWVEKNIHETFTFYRLPRQHHKHLKSTNMLERLNQELKRRTNVVRIFPNEASCLRIIRALAAETHEGWMEDSRYLNMELLRDHKREQLRQRELAA
jgi:putative transposase